MIKKEYSKNNQKAKQKTEPRKRLKQLTCKTKEHVLSFFQVFGTFLDSTEHRTHSTHKESQTLHFADLVLCVLFSFVCICFNVLFLVQYIMFSYLFYFMNECVFSF